MPRSVRLYTTTQVDQVQALIESITQRTDLSAEDREQLREFQNDLRQTAREDRRRAAGTARLSSAAAGTIP
jgi:hypothetical protein